MSRDGGSTRRRGDHDSLHALFLQPAQVAGFPVRGAVRRTQDHCRALLVDGVFEAAHRLCGERVGGVERDCPEAPAVAAAPHLVRGRTTHETESVDHGEDSCERFRCRRGSGRFSALDAGAEGHAGVFGHVLYGHPSREGASTEPAAEMPVSDFAGRDERLGVSLRRVNCLPWGARVSERQTRLTLQLGRYVNRARAANLRPRVRHLPCCPTYHKARHLGVGHSAANTLEV